MGVGVLTGADSIEGARGSRSSCHVPRHSCLGLRWKDVGCDGIVFCAAIEGEHVFMTGTRLHSARHLCSRSKGNDGSASEVPRRSSAGARGYASPDRHSSSTVRMRRDKLPVTVTCLK